MRWWAVCSRLQALMASPSEELIAQWENEAAVRTSFLDEREHRDMILQVYKRWGGV